MPEILTESFCERCGTRYTFESAAPRAARLKGIKVLSRGLKNFVMSDDTSMDEAMAAARSETDREVTTQQLDAFHKTFNFCMTCRQYTCGNCWNEAEGRCLTCAPHLGHEILPAPFPDLDAAAGLTMATNGSNGSNGHAHLDESAGVMAWPTSDLMRDAEAEATEASGRGEPIEEIDAAARLAALGGLAAVTAADDEPTGGMDAAAEPAEADVAPVAWVEPEPMAAAATAEAPETTAAADAAEPIVPDLPGPAAVEPGDLDGRAAAATAQTAALFRRFRPGQNLDDEIAAYEREQEAAAQHADATAVGAAAAAAALEPAAEVPAAVPPAAEPVAATAESEPREDIVPQPTWQIVAPEAPGTPAAEPQAAEPEPQWPSQVEWPSQRPAGGLPFLGRPAQPTGALESLWAESAREVATAPARPTTSVQPCVSCGLSLSATARFCRRCGTRQG